MTYGTIIIKLTDNIIEQNFDNSLKFFVPHLSIKKLHKSVDFIFIK